MGGIGVLIALGGPWLLPFFTEAHDADAAAAVRARAAPAVARRGLSVLRRPESRQRTVPARRGRCAPCRPRWCCRCALAVFVPLAHALTFAPGQGWVDFLPQLGWGAVGGWIAVVVYVMVLGSALFLRWRSRAWQAIRI